MMAPKLTDEEGQHTMAALHFLRKRFGTWLLLAKALGFEPSTMRNVKKGTKRVSVNMAYRVARLTGAPFDDITSGRWPAPGTCPHCGRGPS
jgi:DNA-binding XRE family transcriptional regulator